MRVSICSTRCNPLGDLLLQASEDSQFNFLARRLTRTATLDGGAVIADNGFSAADGTFKIIVDPQHNSATLYSAVVALIKTAGLVTVSARDGLFLAALQNVTNDKTVLTINLLIKSQLA